MTDSMPLNEKVAAHLVYAGSFIDCDATKVTAYVDGETVRLSGLRLVAWVEVVSNSRRAFFLDDLSEDVVVHCGDFKQFSIMNPIRAAVELERRFKESAA